jgi:hypothetical protein
MKINSAANTDINLKLEKFICSFFVCKKHNSTITMLTGRVNEFSLVTIAQIPAKAAAA